MKAYFGDVHAIYQDATTSSLDDAEQRQSHGGLTRSSPANYTQLEKDMLLVMTLEYVLLTSSVSISKCFVQNLCWDR